MILPPSDPPKPAVPPTPTLAHRQTEASDARMAIRHHEDQQGKKKSNHHDQASSPFGAIDDDMVLSVQALIDFLDQFIRTYQSDPQNKAYNHQASDIKSDPDRPSVSPTGQAAQAASAYTHAAATRVRDIQGIPPSSTPDTTTNKVQVPELRRAALLMVRLHDLARRGIKGVQVQSGADFLELLEAAIAKAGAVP